MPKIKALPFHVVEKIAAGEVVERPASVAKELIENAIDAHAKNIIVRTQAGGKKQLTIIDDGSGMDAEDAKLCIGRHATSKIASEADLWKIDTLGFRGEALAAIAAVSKLAIETKLQDPSIIEGTRVEVLGSDVVDVHAVGCPAGTKIVVADLFFNTPVRQKFLKSDTVEYGHIADAIMSHALAHADIRFELTRDGKSHLIYPAVSDPKRRMIDVLGCKPDLMSFMEQNEGISVSGWLGAEDMSSPGAKLLHVFLNGRPLRDRLLTQAVIKGYGSRLPGGRYPLAVVFLNINPEKVDVNVHPAKREVRFEKSGAVFEFVASSIRKALEGQRSAALPSYQATVPEISTSQFQMAMRERVQAALERYEESRDFGITKASPASMISFETNFDPAQQTSYIVQSLQIIGQLSATYILCEGEAGTLVVIDQHAAHEKLGFDAFRKQFEQGSIVQQRLLLPQQCSLTPKEAGYVEVHLSLLEKAGFEIEPFGNSIFMIKAVPALLTNAPLQTLLEKIAAELEASEKSDAVAFELDRLFALMACHRQIRGGDRLSVAEMEALLRDMDREKVTHCPHGRPVKIFIEQSELEKRFKRS
ncbi:MAG: DNA mismatch repair endonuclease MutL [Deltaproteobacteria bacterium]|nr:DNA mismatch repair endonuclease MutL [Deltaproteobacteria bacterium]